MKTLFNTRTFWVGLCAVGAAAALFGAGLCRLEAAVGLGLSGVLILHLAFGVAGAREAAS